MGLIPIYFHHYYYQHKNLVKFSSLVGASVRWKVLYNILIEFGIPTKLIGLIKMFLN
jgi:hypothetical protein